jgi:hypothetical protein
MSTGNASSINRSYALPFGFKATFRWCDAHLRVDWEPHFPRIAKQRARRKFVAAYQAVRRDFYTDVAVTIGGNILVIDSDGKTINSMETIAMPTKQ